MRCHLRLLSALLFTSVLAVLSVASLDAGESDRRFLYVAVPGIRNDVEYGGVGILVYDVDAGYRFVKRIPTFGLAAGEAPENVKGIAASAKTHRLYVTTPRRLAAFDLVTEKMLWNRTYDGGCDRMALSPDGTLLYVPSFEGPHWSVVDALSGDVVATLLTKSGAHNTVYGLDGGKVYLAGLASPELFVADPKTHTVAARVGPFGHFIRLFTVNAAQTLCFVNVNELLGFEVGDLRTGKVLHRVEWRAMRRDLSSATGARATASASPPTRRRSGSQTAPTAACTSSTRPRCRRGR
jgi:hypothetical protein